VAVTQAAAPAQAATLTLSHATWSAPRTASSLTVSVTSNRAWNVSSNANWLTVTPASGTNNGSFTINATANNGTASRTGTITVTAPGAPTRTVSVTQSGTPAGWWAYTDVGSGTQFLVSTSRMASAGNFSNVYVGIARRTNSAMGNVFALTNNGWQFIGVGSVIQTFGGELLSYDEIHPHFDGELLFYDEVHPNYYMYDDLGIERNYVDFAPLSLNFGAGIFHQVGSLGANRNIVALVWVDIKQRIASSGFDMQIDALLRRMWTVERNDPHIINTIYDLFREWLSRTAHTAVGNFVSSEEFMRAFNFMHYIAMSQVPSAAFIEARYVNNSRHLSANPIQGYIYGQRNAPQSSLYIGPLGTGYQHGCGPFAIHNALYYLNSTVPNTARTIRELEYGAAFNLGGVLGTNPIAIESYLRSANMNPNLIAGPATNDLDAQIRNSAASILLYQGSRIGYIHYVMIRPVGNQFLVYNLGGGNNDPTAHASITTWIDDTPRRPLTLITLAPTPQIQATVIPNAVVNTHFSHTLRSTRGTATWSLAAGNLPTGLSLSANGVISGIPRAQGSFTFTVRATNAAGRAATRQITLSPRGGVDLPILQSVTLPPASYATQFNVALQATSDTPITWGIAYGYLPPGLDIDTHAGIIYGTPQAYGVFDFTVSAENDAGVSMQQLYVEVEVPPIGPATIVGPHVLQLIEGYSATNVTGFTVTGNPAVTIRTISYTVAEHILYGLITWCPIYSMLTIAAGIPRGFYIIVFTACNGIYEPDFHRLVLTVSLPSTHFILGDVNGDGIVDFNDVMDLRLYLGGRLSYLPNRDAADLNSDGAIDHMDLSLLVILASYIAPNHN